MNDSHAEEKVVTRDYEIIWNEGAGQIKRAYYNGLLSDILEEAKKKALEIGGTTPVAVMERKHVASVTLGTSVEFKR